MHRGHALFISVRGLRTLRSAPPHAPSRITRTCSASHSQTLAATVLALLKFVGSHYAHVLLHHVEGSPLCLKQNTFLVQRRQFTCSHQ